MIIDWPRIFKLILDSFIACNAAISWPPAAGSAHHAAAAKGQSQSSGDQICPHSEKVLQLHFSISTKLLQIFEITSLIHTNIAPLFQQDIDYFQHQTQPI